MAHIDQILSSTPGPAIPVEREVVAGHAAAEITRVAEDRGSRMIVMSTHGLTGLAHLLMGSVTEHVIRSAPCPVFVVKSYGRSLVGTAHAAEQAHMEHFQ
jgi:nucleotide-binding universal stress UspA family protein